MPKADATSGKAETPGKPSPEGKQLAKEEAKSKGANADGKSGDRAPGVPKFSQDGPSYANVNLRVTHRLPFGDSRGVDLVAEMFNLFDRRNDGMTQKIEQFLTTPKIYFVAVGAGHLTGERGILAQLRGKNYTIEQLEDRAQRSAANLAR